MAMRSSRRAYRGVVVNPSSLTETELIEDGAVVVGADGSIEAVIDCSADASAEVLAGVDEVVDRRGEFIVPGFVDAHAHAPQYAFTGTGMDLPLLEWLEKYTFPCESRFSDLNYAERVYSKAVRRHLRGGTTTVSYFASLHLEATKLLVDVVRRAGQRAYVGKVSMDRNSPENYVETTEDGLRDAEEFVRWTLEAKTGKESGVLRALERARSASISSGATSSESSDESSGDEVGAGAVHDASLVTPVITPRFVPTCTPEMLAGLGDIATRYCVPVQSHLGETLPEIAWVRSLHPECPTYTDVYDHYGLLPSAEKPEERPPVAYMAHCCHCCGEEREILHNTGTGVVHCPNSNFGLGSGVLHVKQMLAEGVKVGLGTDVAGGYSASMLDCMRQAIIASKTVTAAEEGNLDNLLRERLRDGAERSSTPAEPLTIPEVLYLATMGGAECLGLERSIGSFAPGKKFDALFINLEVEDSPVDTFPHDTTWDAFQKFVFNGDDRNIVEVLVNGRSVVNKTAERFELLFFGQEGQKGEHEELPGNFSLGFERERPSRDIEKPVPAGLLYLYTSISYPARGVDTLTAALLGVDIFGQRIGSGFDRSGGTALAVVDMAVFMDRSLEANRQSRVDAWELGGRAASSRFIMRVAWDIGVSLKYMPFNSHTMIDGSVFVLLFGPLSYLTLTLSPKSLPLPQPILLRAVHARDGALEVELQLDVQVPRVAAVRRAGDGARDLLVLADGERVLEVEHRLLPVRVLGVRSRGEGDRRVQLREAAVEVGDKRVAVVVAEEGALEGCLEVQVLDGAGHEVQLQDGHGVGEHARALDRVHKRLKQREVLDGRHVKAVDVVPVVDLLIHVLAVFDAANVERSGIGQQQPVVDEPAIPGVDDGVQHGLIEQEVPHPLADDAVHLGDPVRQLVVRDLLALLLQHRNLVRKAVRGDDLPRLVSDAAALNGNHVRRAGARGEHGQDTRAAAHVHDHLAREQMRIIHDGVAVAHGAHGVLQHLLMDAEVAVGVEVVALEVAASGANGAAAGACGAAGGLASVAIVGLGLE
eukprot:CAMPEP_0118867778 /NCGR_PEP_ID=MMETSP1163-20130328/11251_1 /TAXON_ID=124430 /ORGANISM="Phaeomonas parva, Strain CCMP2877" /LENGTH=1045 /DNA_ID=CAMNT_0006802227 /DNA_START=145 /DNA_END=3281 /DNA_ORIENTATION=+